MAHSNSSDLVTVTLKNKTGGLASNLQNMNSLYKMLQKSASQRTKITQAADNCKTLFQGISKWAALAKILDVTYDEIYDLYWEKKSIPQSIERKLNLLSGPHGKTIAKMLYQQLKEENNVQNHTKEVSS